MITKSMYLYHITDKLNISKFYVLCFALIVDVCASGGTLSKCINRGCATLVAGALGFGSQHLASLFGERGEPVVLGALVFIMGN